MRQLTKFIGIFLLLLLSGCTQDPESVSMEMAEEEAAAPETDQNADETIERKLIKEGQVEFEAENLSAARKTIFKAVSKYKGYVSSDQEFTSPGRVSNTVTIRVPADNFDALLQDATQGIEKFDSREISVKDVTEEFLDIQARLKTKKQLEIRYLDLLKQAKSVPEILEIEKHIAQLRSEIESVEGRLNYLQNQVSLSTLTLTFYENSPQQTEFTEKFRSGLRNGWGNLIWFFVLLTHVWPFILLGLGLLIGLNFYKRKK